MKWFKRPALGIMSPIICKQIFELKLHNLVNIVN